MNAAFSMNDTQSRINLPDLPWGGITPFSLTDYPDQISAVLYLKGCPWRCHYCFNAELQPFSSKASKVTNEAAADFLLSRKKLLDAVVFSGGEATAHPYLEDWMIWAKTLGYKIGLHTAGIYPGRLERLLPYCDWVGMDIKAPFHDYKKVTQMPAGGERALRSVKLILESHVDYEFRTTVHSALLNENDLLDLSAEIAALGGRYYALQKFRSELCPGGEEQLMPDNGTDFSETLLRRMKERFASFKVR